MRKILVIAGILAMASTALAGNEVAVTRYVSLDAELGFGTVIDNQNFHGASGKWTSLFNPSGFPKVCMDISFTRVAATGVTMRCEGVDDGSAAEDAGYDIHTQAIAAGVGTSNIYVPTYTVSSSQKWTWCIPADLMPYNFVRCRFDDVASGGVTDFITVVAKGVQP